MQVQVSIQLLPETPLQRWSTQPAIWPTRSTVCSSLTFGYDYATRGMPATQPQIRAPFPLLSIRYLASVSKVLAGYLHDHATLDIV